MREYGLTICLFASLAIGCSEPQTNGTKTCEEASTQREALNVPDLQTLDAPEKKTRGPSSGERMVDTAGVHGPAIAHSDQQPKQQEASSPAPNRERKPSTSSTTPVGPQKQPESPRLGPDKETDKPLVKTDDHMGVPRPASAVLEFLDAVRNGDVKKTERMLSSAARRGLDRMDAVVRPPGSDTAEFEVGEVGRLPDGRVTVASAWTDRRADGRLRTDNVTWIVREEADGWRVCGMIATPFPGRPAIILDFENPQNTLRNAEAMRTATMKRGLQSDQGGQSHAGSGEFGALHARLQRLGVSKWILQTDDQKQGQYRCRCTLDSERSNIRAKAGPQQAKQFQATDTDPLRAMAKVIDALEVFLSESRDVPQSESRDVTETEK